MSGSGRYNLERDTNFLLGLESEILSYESTRQRLFCSSYDHQESYKAQQEDASVLYQGWTENRPTIRCLGTPSCHD
uniref:Uncharacterized protein n=1 Tax=Lepeophtheirus salmonis TaxID=72036 RepID=A0A0K2V0V1_LEPSM